jgi:hypothetical protein
MSYTISELKTDIEGNLHGTTLNKLPGNFNDLAWEAARTLIAKIDPRETIRKSPITNAIFNDIYSYPLPADIKGDKFISILPQTNVGVQDNISQVYGENFELYKGDLEGIARVDYQNANKVLKLSINGGKAGKTINSVDGITDNGTWAVSSDASNLSEDTLNKYSGRASLKFDLDTAVGASTGVLTNSTMTAIDCSDEEDVGSFFMPVFLSDATNITSVQLKWGSDSSNHWKQTVTGTSEGLDFQDGWNLLKFDWQGATQTASPVASAVDYVEVTINYDGTATPNCRIDNIVLRLGEIYNIKYYSKYLFRNSSGIWINKPTADTDIVNLDEDSYNILLFILSYMVTQKIQGEDGVFDRNFFETELEKAVKEYKSNYRSEAIKPQSNYYRPLGRTRRRGSINNRR